MKKLKNLCLFILCIPIVSCSNNQNSNVSLWNNNLVFESASIDEVKLLSESIYNFFSNSKIKLEASNIEQQPFYSQYKNQDNYLLIPDAKITFVALHPQKNNSRLFLRSDFDSEIKILDKGNRPYSTITGCVYESFQINDLIYENCSEYSFNRLIQDLNIKSDFFPSPLYPHYGYIYNFNKSNHELFSFIKNLPTPFEKYKTILKSNEVFNCEVLVAKESNNTYLEISDSNSLGFLISCFILSKQTYFNNYNIQTIVDYINELNINIKALICIKENAIEWIDIKYSHVSDGIVPELAGSISTINCRLSFYIGDLVGFNHTSTIYFTPSKKEYISKLNLIKSMF